MDWLVASPMPPSLLLRVAVAAVWLYEGLWCKLLGGVPHQTEVVAAHPLFGPRLASGFLSALAVVEIALAVWVLSGFQPVLAAVAQTALLVFMTYTGAVLASLLVDAAW